MTNYTLHYHFSKCSGVSQPWHWGDASFDLSHTISVDRASFSPPLTLTDCRSDEMTGDQWRAHPLKWLQVSLQGYPPCLICRWAPVGPWHPLISPSQGKEAPLSKSSTVTFEWQQGRGIGDHRANCSSNCFRMNIFLLPPRFHLAAIQNPFILLLTGALYGVALDSICQTPEVQTTEK